MKPFITFVAMIIATLLSVSAKSITPEEAANTASDPFHTDINQNVAVDMEAMPLEVITDIEPGIDVDLSQLLDPNLDPNSYVTISAALPLGDGGIPLLFVNDERITSIFNDEDGRTYFTFFLTYFHEPLEVRIISGSSFYLSGEDLTADTTITPGCTATITSILTYYKSSYTYKEAGIHTVALALCDASGRILKLYNPTSYQGENSKFWTADIPANTPENAYLCIVTSTNLADWKEAKDEDGYTLTRIPMGYDNANIKFCLSYYCECLPHPCVYITYYHWGEKIQEFNFTLYNTDYEFLGWDEEPDFMPNHDMDVQAKLLHHNGSNAFIPDITYEEEVNSKCCFDLSGRKICASKAPRGSVIISDGKKFVVGR